ncbi:hypothetical protein [Streptomyces sp. T028]|uniref:hypothetical protein n=1 Tax=Streptomyces sp. T028 TaxID=3394379 RepID=UPI003A888F3E
MPADRRASVFTLTAAGREQFATWTSAHERPVDAALTALDQDSLTAIANAPEGPRAAAVRHGTKGKVTYAARASPSR